MSDAPDPVGFVRPWLVDWPFDDVERLNAALCQPKQVQHGRTSDGYAVTRELWEKARLNGPLPLTDAVTLCKKCHRTAPFLNFNGNTFAAIARRFIEQLPLGGMEKASLRQLTGHMVAGVLPYEAETKLLAKLQAPSG